MSVGGDRYRQGKTLGKYTAWFRDGYGELVIHGFDHKRVNHGVNAIEGFWAQLKRSINGTHIHVSSKYLWKYAKEAEYRFNRRHRPHSMFDELLRTFRS